MSTDKRTRVVFKADLGLDPRVNEAAHLTDQQWVHLISAIDDRPWLFALPEDGPGPARIMLPGEPHCLRIDPDGSRYREAWTPEEDTDASG